MSCYELQYPDHPYRRQGELVRRMEESSEQPIIGLQWSEHLSDFCFSTRRDAAERERESRQRGSGDLRAGGGAA